MAREGKREMMELIIIRKYGGWRKMEEDVRDKDCEREREMWRG